MRAAAEQRPAAAGYSLYDLEKLTRKIADQELALLRLNTYFLLENERVSKWAPWRIFLYRMSASGLSNAGAITGGAAQWGAYRHPKTLGHGAVKAGGILLLTGNCISIGGACAEILFDLVTDLRLRQRHINLQAARQRFLALLSELDQALARRDAMAPATGGLSAGQRRIVEADGALLRDVRDLSVREFKASYERITRALWVRGTANAMAVEGGATGGLLGSLNVLLAATDHHPNQAGSGGLGYVISGASAMATPPILKLSGSLGAARASRKLAGAFAAAERKSVEDFMGDRKRLEELVDEAAPAERGMLSGLSARETLYGMAETLWHNQVLSASEAAARTRRSYLERMVWATLVGGSNIPRGVATMVGGFHYPRSPSRFLEMGGVANVCWTAGTGLWMLDTVQGRLREELQHRRLARIKAAPVRQMRERLESLEELEDLMQVF